jgi:hypothetical protein
VIIFASSITDPGMYERCAEPGIRLAAEPDSKVMPLQAAGSIFKSYNLIMDKAAEHDDLEALVILHQDSEIVGPDFCQRLRRVMQDPDVGLVGCVGAIGVRSIAWWEGSVTWASFTHRYPEMGGGEMPAFSWVTERLPAYAHTGEVETIDGFVMCMSPWVVRNLRFDESLGQLHGYDFDFSLQVRHAGKKVMTENFPVVHHHSLELVSDPENWVEAHIKIAEKWAGKMPGVGEAPGDWKTRARRAEAEAAVARTTAVSAGMQYDAREAQLLREIEEMTESISWKITKPLRELNALRRRAAPRIRRRRHARDGTNGAGPAGSNGAGPAG